MYAQVDGVVTSVMRSGFFVDCGALQVFVSSQVRLSLRFPRDRS